MKTRLPIAASFSLALGLIFSPLGQAQPTHLLDISSIPVAEEFSPAIILMSEPDNFTEIDGPSFHETLQYLADLTTNGEYTYSDNSARVQNYLLFEGCTLWVHTVNTCPTDNSPHSRTWWWFDLEAGDPDAPQNREYSGVGFTISTIDRYGVYEYRESSRAAMGVCGHSELREEPRVRGMRRGEALIDERLIRGQQRNFSNFRTAFNHLMKMCGASSLSDISSPF